MKRFRWLCSLGLVVAAWCGTVHAETPLPTLEEIQKGYFETLNTINTLEYQARIDWQENEGQWPGDPTKKMYTHVVRSGIRKFIQTNSRSRSGEHESLSILVFDGQRYSAFSQDLSVSADPTPSPPNLRISHEPPGSWRDTISVEKLQGNQLWGGDQGLQQLLTKPGVQVTGWEEVSGTPSVRVTFPNYAPLAGAPTYMVRVVVWFDPTHGYLPRRIRLDQLPHKTSTCENYRDMEVLRFEQVSDVAKRGTRLWFPVEGYSRNPVSTYRIEAENVVLNFEIPERRFRPIYPDGTIIHDQTRPDAQISFVGDIEPEFLKKIRPPVKAE